MKNIKLGLATFFLASLTVSCSNQYRSVSMDDWAFVAASLEEVTANSSSSEVNQFKQLASLPGASVYYSDSPGYGSATSVASLGSFAFFGRSDLWMGNLSEVRVFFVDVTTTQGRQAALILSIKEAGSEQFQTQAFASTRHSVIEDDEFVAVLGTNGAELLTLRTLNVDEDGELEGIIKLEVSEFDAQGVETFIGQFSTMVGYQN